MRPRTSAGWMILLVLSIATGPAWRATPALAAQSTVAPRASDRHAPAEVPCTQLRSAMHGVMLIGARLPIVGGPACDVMREYADWLQRSDTLLTSRRSADARFTGREWDFAIGAMRLGAPRDFFLIRGDSLSATTPATRSGTRWDGSSRRAATRHGSSRRASRCATTTRSDSWQRSRTVARERVGADRDELRRAALGLPAGGSC